MGARLATRKDAAREVYLLNDKSLHRNVDQSCRAGVREGGQTPAASATAAGVSPLKTCRAIRSRPCDVSRG